KTCPATVASWSIRSPARFARLNEIERAYNDLRARVGVLEDRAPARPAPANDSRRTMSDGRHPRLEPGLAGRAAPGARAISGRLVELEKLKPDRAAQEPDRPKRRGRSRATTGLNDDQGEAARARHIRGNIAQQWRRQAESEEEQAADR